MIDDCVTAIKPLLTDFVAQVYKVLFSALIQSFSSPSAKPAGSQLG